MDAVGGDDIVAVVAQDELARRSKGVVIADGKDSNLPARVHDCVPCDIKPTRNGGNGRGAKAQRPLPRSREGIVELRGSFQARRIAASKGTGGLYPHWTVREKGSAAWSLISKTFVLLRDNSPSTGLSREWKIVPHCTSAAALVFHVVNGDRGVVENALCTQCRTAPGER
jgi:hypothetical protein